MANTLPNSFSTSMNVDLQIVFQRISWDIMLFVAAGVAYLVLHHMKTRKVESAKIAHKRASLVAEQDTPPKCIDSHPSVQPLSQVCVIKAEPKPTSQSPVAPAQAPAAPETFDIAKHLALMQKYSAARNIKEALRTFRMIQRSGEQMSSAMYNTILWAWVRCGNVFAAETWMDDIKEAGMLDEHSFLILIKALLAVRDIDKAHMVLNDMQEAGLFASSAAVFDEFILAYSRVGEKGVDPALYFEYGLCVLEKMSAANVQPTCFTSGVVAKFVNSARSIRQRCSRLESVLVKYGVGGMACSPMMPLLVAAVSSSAADEHKAWVHDFEIKGSFSQLKAAVKTFKQFGFLDRSIASQACRFDGHWETNQSEMVVIERKIVRLTGCNQGARLRFNSADPNKCELRIQGKCLQGELVPPLLPGATKALKWDNGDVWHCCEAPTIQGSRVFSQSMTKISCDKMQDVAYRARSAAVLKCVSKQGLGMPAGLDDAIVQYLGSSLCKLRVHFLSDTARADVFDYISAKHPRIGIRHCWVKPSSGVCGQRTVICGEEEMDDASFCRHINEVSIA